MINGSKMINSKLKRPARVFVLCLAALMAVVFMPLASGQDSAYRSIYAADPPSQIGGVYQLGTADDMIWFSNEVNTGTANLNAVLTADIDLSGAIGSTFVPIGTGTTSGTKYTGTFDGDGKKITLSIDAATADYQGVFGYIGGGGKVKNLTASGSVKGSKYVGGIAGYLDGGTIEHVTNSAIVTGNLTETSYAGGIVGRVSASSGASSIKNAFNYGDVKGYTNVGGIAGYMYPSFSATRSVIEGVENHGSVSAAGNGVGGIVGSLSQYSTVKDAINNGNVTNSGNGHSVGGIIGSGTLTVTWADTFDRLVNNGNVTTNDTGNYGVGGIVGTGSAGLTIKNSYNTGDITGSCNYIGGIAGSVSPIISCFNTGKVTGKTGATYVGGIIGYDGSANTTVNTTANIGVISSESGQIGGIHGNGSGPGPCNESYYLRSVAIVSNGKGTPLDEEDFRAKMQAMFPGSIILGLIEQRIYETVPVLSVYRQVGSDGESVFEKKYTRKQLDDISDITDNTGYLNAWQIYKTKNALTLEKLIKDALGADTAFYSDAHYVVESTDTAAPASKTFTFADLTGTGNFYPATTATGYSRAETVTNAAGAYAVKPALGMTSVLENLFDLAPATAGADLSAWDGVIDRTSPDSKTMQFLIGTSEDDYLGKVIGDGFVAGVDKITIIRYADETVVEIAKRLDDQGKAIDDLQKQIDDINNKIRENDKQHSSDIAGQSAEKLRLEGEKARLEAEKAALEKEKAALAAELDKQANESQAKLTAANIKAFTRDAAKISKLKAAKKSATLTWKKIAEAQGYQIVYAANKKFTGKKTITVNSKASATIYKTTVKKLKKGKTYYFKVRAFTKIGDKIVYTQYSPVKKVKIKK